MNRRIVCLTLAVAGASSSVLLFAGCGDDTTTPVQGVDSGPDVSTPDSTTGTGVDAGADQTTTADVANDQTTADAGSDAASDSSTASDGDAASDGAACVPFDASGLDDAAVQAGMLALWTVYQCQKCHQNASQMVDDAGNGLVLSGNNKGLANGDASPVIFPPNLTNDPATGLGCWTDMQVVNAILKGVDNEGKNLCPSMPRWGNALQLPMDGGPRSGTPMDAGTAQQIVDFLRSLPVVSNMVTQTMCPMPAQDGGSDAAADGGGAEAGNDGGGDTGTVDATADAGDGATE